MTTLMIDSGPAAAPDAPVTRVGGVPLAPAGTAWPHCSACGGPMQFLVQILLDDVGGAARPDGAAPGPVLAVFACQNDPGGCADWDPASGGNRALLFPAEGLEPIPLPRTDDPAEESDEESDEDDDAYDDAYDDEENVLLLEGTRAVARAREEESDYRRAREAWAARSGRPASEVIGQLGGAPAWIQWDDTPSCRACSRPMPLVAQLQEGIDPGPVMNFGSGRAYAFACEPCAEAAFLWQC
ncbi:DUF1963 domain-containing protein [Streptomyces sp. NPDC046866]|uniref:DUF1963 domain-containing protein n=1 Tax=Streptomyces sp. NPDC046866 TaxID=3154921 RepID=UPI0034563DB6